MPRDGSGIYTTPAGTTAVPDTTIESAKYNGNVADVAADLNAPRPIVAGGTGATSAKAARTALGAEAAFVTVTNYDTHPWESGSFFSAPGATGAPTPGDYYVGTAIVDAAVTVAVLTAINISDPLKAEYIRSKGGGTWTAWTTPQSSQFVKKTGDTMSGNLFINTASMPTLALDAPAGNHHFISSKVGGVDRWNVIIGDATPETGGNAGSNLAIWRYNDAGAGIDTPFTIERSTGVCNVYATPVSPSSVANKGYVDGTDALRVAKAGDTMSGNLTLRYAAPLLAFDKNASGAASSLWTLTNGVLRWNLEYGSATAESGAATGSDIVLHRYDNAGGYLGQMFFMERATGNMQLAAGKLTVSNGTQNTNWFDGALRVDGGIGAAGNSWFQSNVRMNSLTLPVGAENYYITRNGSTGFMNFSGNQNGFSGYEFWTVGPGGEGWRPFMITNNAQLTTRYTAGTMMCDGSGNLYVSSDGALKNVIAPFTRGLEALRAIGGADIFSFKHEEKTLPDQRYAGFVAQKVQRAIPEAVGVSHDGMLTLDDRPLIATLMNAVLELSDRIDKLTGGKK